ncbi:hypothetical protein PGTUg99_003201 [Puccinia graminis f. sp. tritici]|uniref:Uncharacterized protein n=1 Tax=Puccinia graminis f. sp. tritici TaxID=56615 RepID=A0A5B0S935_PUCGR|nr:hypothetical protein PGTUg99_003201 [Puccinia graminis f. sp. tritici]
MYQPCHRCDRARSAISVPSPRHTSSPWASLYIPPGFNRQPPHLVFFLVTRPTCALVRPVTLRILSSTVLASRLRSALNQWRFYGACILVVKNLNNQTKKNNPVAWFYSSPHHSISIPPSPSRCFSVHHQNAPPSLETAVGRSDPSIDIGVRYYPDRDQWSPVFNPNVVPDDNSVGDKGPIDPAGNKGPIDTVATKDKEPAEATVDPALINTIDKWHAINDPSRHYDCVTHPFVCVPWNVHDPKLPPGLPVPFLRTLNLPVPAPTPAQSQPPSTSSSETSSNNSDQRWAATLTVAVSVA